MAEADPKISESIDDVMLRLCRENDLKALQIECRAPDAGTDWAFDATAIWEGFSSSGYSNCSVWGRTAATAVASVLKLAQMQRAPASAPPEPLAAAFATADQVPA